MPDSIDILRRVFVSGSEGTCYTAGKLVYGQVPPVGGIASRPAVLDVVEREGRAEEAIELLKLYLRNGVANSSLPCPTVAIYMAAVYSLSDDSKLREKLYLILPEILKSGSDWLRFYSFRSSSLAKKPGDSSKHFGTGLKKAFTRWFHSFPRCLDLAFALTNDGSKVYGAWTMKDLVKLHHLKAMNDNEKVVLRCILGNVDLTSRDSSPETWPVLVWFQNLKTLRQLKNDVEGATQARLLLEKNERLSLHHLPYNMLLIREPWEELILRTSLQELFPLLRRMFWGGLLNPEGVLYERVLEKFQPGLKCGLEPSELLLTLKEFEDPEKANKTYITKITQGGKLPRIDKCVSSPESLPAAPQKLIEILKIYINRSIIEYAMTLPPSTISEPTQQRVLVLLDSRSIVGSDKQACYYSQLVMAQEAIGLFAFVIWKRYKADLMRICLEKTGTRIKSFDVPASAQNDVFSFTEHYGAQLQDKVPKIETRKLVPSAAVLAAPLGYDVIVILGSSNYNYGASFTFAEAIRDYRGKPGSNRSARGVVCAFYNRKYRLTSDVDEHVFETMGLDKFTLRIVLSYIDCAFY